MTFSKSRGSSRGIGVCDAAFLSSGTDHDLLGFLSENLALYAGSELFDYRNWRGVSFRSSCLKTLAKEKVRLR